MGPVVRIAVLLFSLLSGFSALLYQVVWAREFAVVLGSTVQSISTVLAAFMAGLGIGGIVGGSFVDRSGRPLKTYAGIEITIAAAALVLQFVVSILPEIYGTRFPVVRFLIAFSILCLPTFFMGATIPALARFALRETHRGVTAAWIYGLNTLGAAAGAFAAGFLLIEQFGLSGTLRIAVSVNIVIAVLSWWISSRSDAKQPAPSAGESKPCSTFAVDKNTGLILYALSGFVALGLEVAWTRTLVFSIGATTYAFSSMLAIVLIGLSIGSVLIAPLLKRSARRLQWIAVGQAIVAILSVLCLWLFDHLSTPLREWLSYSESLHWPYRIGIQMLQAAVLLLPSGIVFGAMFPLCADLYLRSHKTGADMGRLLGANTFAAIAGSLLTGFVFIPELGIQRTYALLGSVSILAVLYALRLPRWSMAVVAGVWSIGLALLPSRVLEPVLPTQKLLFYEEGSNGTISVVEDSAGDRNLLIDHIAVAGTDPVFMTDQKSLAHLPMLLHPDPKRVLTVGFGSGGASFSFTRYPQLESIRAVEIDPAVLKAAPYFKATNGDPFTDPRFAVIRDDVRSHLLYTTDSYDIITTDCTDLRYKSNALLYTKEFFEIARQRLKPNGLVVAWVPLGGLSSDDLKTTLRTFSETFPHSSAWYMYNYPTHYLLVVGSASELKVNLDQIRERLAIPTVRDDLAGIGLDDPVRLVASYMKDHGGLAEFAKDAQINSDDRPVLEFSVPRGPHGSSLSNNLEQFTRDTADLTKLTALPEVDAVMRARALILQGHVLYNKPGFHYRTALELYRQAESQTPGDRWLQNLMLATEQTARDRRKEYESLAESARSDYQVLNDLGLLREDAGDIDGALSMFQRAAEIAPSVALLHMNLGRVLDAKGMAQESISAYEKAIQLDPQFGEVWNNLGVVYLQQNENEKALSAFQNAVRLAPQNYLSWINLGLAAFRSDKRDRARDAFDRAVQLNPAAADAYLNRAILRMAEGDMEAAYSDLRSALDRKPDYAEIHYNIGIVEEQRKNPAEAASHYRRAIELNPKHVLAYNNLGILYSDAGQSRQAIETYAKAVAIDPRNPALRNNLAMEYVRTGNLTDAIHEYQEAIALQPGMFEPYANLGMIYRRRNQTAEAEKYLTEARRLNPNLKIP
jgi:tetratricopeptide (TPR) repeat protein/spermidine synthase